MLKFDSLRGIAKEKKGEVKSCLDDLLTHHTKRGQLKPVISGYNWYSILPTTNRVVTLSHVHETSSYKEAMIHDLEKQGYERQLILSCIRDKGTRHLWNPEYRIRDSNKRLLSLRIEDKRKCEYIDLKDYTESLSNYPEFKQSEGYLINEDANGWELDMPFHNEQELSMLVKMFVEKSHQLKPDPWPDAYYIPVIIIGNAAVNHAHKFPEFDQAVRIYLSENNNEISFIVHDTLSTLHKLKTYVRLKKLGFQEETCLANKSFLEDIDKFKYLER